MSLALSKAWEGAEQGLSRVTQGKIEGPLCSHHMRGKGWRSCSACLELEAAVCSMATTRRIVAEQGLGASIVFSADSSC